MAMKRKSGTGTTLLYAAPLGSMADGGLAFLEEQLVTLTYDDGSVRRTSTVTLFAEDGRWKGCLSDRDQGMVLFATGDSAAGVLEALDEALGSGHPDWRRAGRQSPPRR